MGRMVGSSLLLRCVLIGLLAVPLALGPVGPASAAGVPISRDATGTDYRPAVAEAPDSDRVAAIWIHETSVRIAVSDDGGVTWRDEVELAGYSRVYVDHPRLAYGNDGTLHAVWWSGLGAERTIVYRFVPPGDDPGLAGSWQWGESPCSNCIEPDFALGPDGWLYLSYRDRAGNRLGIRRLRGACGCWQAGVRAIAAAGSGDLAVTPDGKLHLIYTDENQVFYSRHTSFDDFRREAFQRVSTSGRANLPPVIAAGAGNQAHLVWVQAAGAARTVFYRVATADGLSEPETVSVSVAGRSEVHQWLDVLGVGDDVFATWTGHEENTRGTVYLNRRHAGAWGDPADLSARRVTPSALASRQSRFGQSLRGSILLSYAVRITGMMTSTVLRVETLPPVGPTAPPPLPPPAWLGDDCIQPPETGRTICGPFRVYWLERGGVRLFGFPLTEPRSERNPADGQVYTVQYFERARFEYHPADAPDVVQLGLLGRFITAGREAEPPFQPVDDPGDGTWFAETGHTLRDVFQAYWVDNGGLPVFGYPISEPFNEVNPADGQTYLVQYFERYRFEHHPEQVGTPDEVQLGHLGRQALGDGG